MSGLVGSTPSFTRSGRPSSSCSASRPSGSTSTAPRSRGSSVAASEAVSGGGDVTGPMLDSRARLKRGSPPLFQRDPRHSAQAVGQPGDDGRGGRISRCDRASNQAAEVFCMDSGSDNESANARRADSAKRRVRRRRSAAVRPGPDRRREAHQAEAAQAALRVRHPRPRRARLRLLDLRDHDGRRPGPALAREPRAVQARRELGRLRLLRQQARHADQQPGPHPARPPTRSHR